jgi:hypothetical protein
LKNYIWTILIALYVTSCVPAKPTNSTINTKPTIKQIASDTAPLSPLLGTSTATISTISLSWLPNLAGGNVISFQLRYSLNSNLSNAITISNVISPKTLTGLVSNSTYYYEITASNSLGSASVRGNLATNSTLPGAPVLAAVSGLTSSSATFNWSVGAGGTPASYNVSYSLTSTFPADSTTTISNATTPTTVSNLVANSTYYYKITAFNTSGSNLSQSSFQTSPLPPVVINTKSSYCGPEDRYFPVNAVTVPVSQKANLQALLDANKIIRLEPTNYNVAVTIRAGQQLYGYPGKTRLTNVTIGPGTTDSVVRGLLVDKLSFPTSNISTHDNCFSLIQGTLQAVNSTVENNIFLSFFHSEVDINTSGGGFFKNNKFLRIQSHGGGTYTGKPALNFVGDAARNSTGNTFVFVNQLGSYSTPILCKNQYEVSLVAVDVEDYDTTAGTEAVVTSKNVKNLKIMNLQGGVNQGMLDVDAEEFILLGNAFYRAGDPPFILRSTNQRALWVSAQNNLTNNLTDENPNGTRISAETMDHKHFEVNRASPTSLTGTRATDAIKILAASPNSEPWGRPAERAIADPGGPNWNVDLAAKPDDAPILQALLDANPNGTIQLQARTYYLNSSIKIRGVPTIVGAGTDKTLLIAKSNSINIFETNYTSASFLMPFTFMDFTIQGGNVGFHFGTPNIQSSEFYMSHVTIRDMKTAGIYLNKTYAWDNGYLEYVDFYKNAVGIKVFGENSAINQESVTNAYMDKVFFYRNQYVANQKALEFDPKRQSNMNVWFESSFRDNTVSAVDCSSWNATYFFISSVFSNNAGNPSLNAGTSSYFVNSAFTIGPALSLFSQSTTCEGCDITRGSGSIGTVFKVIADGDPRDYLMSWLVNSNLNDAPLGALTTSPSRWSMLFINSLMAPVDSQYSLPMSMFMYDTMGTPSLTDDFRYSPSYWLTGPVSPGSRFLRQPIR